MITPDRGLEVLSSLRLSIAARYPELAHRVKEAAESYRQNPRAHQLLEKLTRIERTPNLDVVTFGLVAAAKLAIRTGHEEKFWARGNQYNGL